MPITQALNSKGNVKKTTNQDLPYSAAMPVLQPYYAVSTASQVIINLPFSVDQTLTDQFFLFVDGKKLRLGASNDYVFTSIGSDNTSSQVTLNQALPINLNIQAYMLGLKKESEFGTDNRFIQLYEAQSNGFQGFIRQSVLMNPTASVGTPAAGSFYSQITGRAPIVDLSQDLKARMGIDRMMTQQIYQIPNEFGPNGEMTYGLANDLFGQVRFVGGWSNNIIADGQFILTSTATTDYMEVVFYGTGLNVMAYVTSTRDLRASVDGGAEGGNIIPASTSSVIYGRNYSPNTMLTAVSGLTLGVHTVKIRNNSSVQTGIFGFEILNSNTTNVVVNPGVGYIQGKKYTQSNASLFTYNAGATGTRGGRTVVYQNGDSTVSRAFQAVNASQANLTSADHTNEEVTRVYWWKEFGANRADDFSTLGASVSARSFTLDDGTTTLATNSSASTAAINSTTDYLSLDSVVSNFINFNFVGTGLDIMVPANTHTTGYTITVDGTAIATNSTTVFRRTSEGAVKIVSGLPYGTHTVRITVASANGGVGFGQLLVYGPKKPSIPSGAIELADYNIMADYVVNTSAAAGMIATGTLRKISLREFNYVGGGWSVGSFDGSMNGSQYVQTATGGAYYEYTFFGTGFNLRTFFPNSSINQTVSVDGSTNLSGFTTGIYQNGTGLSFTAATGVISGTSSVNTYNSGIHVSGLAPGMHTVRVTLNSGSLYLDAFDIITPIHSTKSNINYDIQNTLPVGSQGLSDSRKLTPVKDLKVNTTNISQAIGVQLNPTTTSAFYVPMPDMSVTHTNKSGRIKVTYTARVAHNTANFDVFARIFVDGIAVGKDKCVGNTTSTANQNLQISDFLTLNVSPGTHKIEIMWFRAGGVASAVNADRILIVEET